MPTVANTNFKIVDFMATNPASQYDFTFPADWAPTNEQQTPAIKLADRDAYPFINLTYFSHYGVSEKIITLQGSDLEDNDRYELSAAISNPRVKKLYLGADWYYYVIGLEPRSMRDDSRPGIYNYTAAFICVDPCMYYDGVGSGDYPAGTVGFGYVDCTSSTTIDLTLATYPDSGSWFVEPIIWIENEGSNTLGLEDELGRKLEFDVPDNDVWIILPYYNQYANKFFPDHPIAFKYSTADLSDFDEFFAPDFTIYSASKEFKKTSGNYGNPTKSDTDSIGYDSNYPKAEWNTATTFTLSGVTAGNIRMQYRFRRM